MHADIYFTGFGANITGVIAFLSQGTSQRPHELNGAIDKNSTSLMSSLHTLVVSASTVEPDISDDSTTGGSIN